MGDTLWERSNIESFTASRVVAIATSDRAGRVGGAGRAQTWFATRGVVLPGENP